MNSFVKIKKKLKNNRAFYKFFIRLRKIIFFENRKKRKHYKKNPLIRTFYRIIFLKRYLKRSNLTVTDYCKAHGIITNVERLKKEDYVYCPPYINGTIIDSKIQFKQYYGFSCKLSKVRIVGENNFILVEDYCLNERFGFKNSDNFDFVNEGNCIEFNKQKSLIEVNLFSKKINKGIALFGEGATNYYHWMFDICGNMAYINKHPEMSDVPLLVDETVYYNDSFLELLRKIDYYQHPIIFLKRNKTYSVNELFYFSPCSFGNVYGKNNPNNQLCIIPHMGYLKNKDVVDMYRGLIGNESKASTSNNRLFVVRKGKSKRLTNEDEALKLCKKYGFIPFSPEEHSLSEQIAYFNKADYVFADYGAGCTNVLWGNTNQKFIVFTPNNRKDFIFSTLAYKCNIKYFGFLTSDYNGELHHTVNLRELEDYLKKEFECE